jgi:hypothetical protein
MKPNRSVLIYVLKRLTLKKKPNKIKTILIKNRKVKNLRCGFE